MSGKRKPLLSSPKDSSSSGDEDTLGPSVGYSSPPPLEYDGASSPGGSSTASGPVYVRLPGFEHHGQEVPAARERHLAAAAAGSSKGKKKKALLSAVLPVSGTSWKPSTSGTGGRNRIAPSPAIGDPSAASTAFSGNLGPPLAPDLRGPAPTTSSTTLLGNVSDGTSSSYGDNSSGTAQSSSSSGVPFSSKGRTKREPLPMKLRALPLSFWQEPNVASGVSPGNMYAKLPPLTSKDSPDGAEMDPTSKLIGDVEKNCGTEGPSQQQDVKRVIRVSNTDWLFKLFEGLEGHDKVPMIKRGRPKKAPIAVCPTASSRDDPYMGNVAAETLWPLVPWCKKDQKQATLTMISLRDRDKSVSLPALHADRNYSQLLSEVVVKL